MEGTVLVAAFSKYMRAGLSELRPECTIETNYLKAIAAIMLCEYYDDR
jgi:hypothetical protein